MEALIRELRFAARALTRSPGYATVAALTLALGIGATTGIFTVVYTVLLKPLPYPQPDRLVQVDMTFQGRLNTTSPPDFSDLQRDSRSFTALGAYYRHDFTLIGAGAEPARAGGARVTPALLAALAVSPALGHAFTARDALTGANPVVLLSNRLWRTRFGGDPGIVGRTVRIDGRDRRVLGVMPPGFAFPGRARLWTPLGFSARELTTQRGAHYLTVVGRLRSGASVASAQSDLAGIVARLRRQYPRNDTGAGIRVRDLKRALVGDYRGRLLILLGAVALVLLIACMNAASLSLARTLDRGHELAVRSALGAGRGRIAGGLLLESLLLAVVAGAVGVVMAMWGVAALVGMQAQQVPRLAGAHVGALPLVFAFGVSTASGLLAGVIPAWRLSGPQVLAARLASAGRSRLGTRGGSRLRAGLVVAETALAVLLLAGAGLLIRSFVNLQRVDPGLARSGVLTFDLSLPDSRYGEPARAEAFVGRLLRRLRATPGVQGAGGVMILPLSGGRYGISVERLDGGPAYDRPSTEKSVQIRVATPDYFRTIGIRLLRGRGFTSADRDGAVNVVVVNQAAARLLWPGADPLGHTLELGTSFGLGRGRARGTVVGVVGDAREWGPRRAAPAMVYVPHAQFPVEDMAVVVRDDGDAARLIPAARRVLHTLDPKLPMAHVATVGELMRESLAQSRFYSLMLTLFAAAALLLATVGIYGITAFAVSRRTREMGVRMALGAAPGKIVRLMLGRGLGLALAGVGAGVLASLGLTRTLRGLLYGLGPNDPPTLAAVTGVLIAAAALASWLPARRAARVDPVVALKHE